MDCRCYSGWLSQDMTEAVWRERVREQFFSGDIELATKRLRDTGQEVTWANVYRLLERFPVRISYYIDVPYDLSGVAGVRLELLGKLLETQGYANRTRLSFYDMTTGNSVPELMLRELNFPLTLVVGLLSDTVIGGERIWRQFPVTVRVDSPYVPGTTRRVEALQIRNDPDDLSKVKILKR